MWQPGDILAWRGIYRKRVWHAQTVLDLDLIINPDFSFEWKDVDDYNEGIERGVILNKWMQEIDKAKQEIFMKMEKREYPLDDSWLKWKPDVNWQQPKLPADWDKV